jgi:hypothetical protein
VPPYLQAIEQVSGAAAWCYALVAVAVAVAMASVWSKVATVKMIQTRGGKLIAFALVVLGARATQQVFSSEGFGRYYAVVSVLFCLVALVRTARAGIYEAPRGDILVRRLWSRPRRFAPADEPRLAFRGPKWSGYKLFVIDRNGAEFGTDLVMAQPRLEPGLSISTLLTEPDRNLGDAPNH